MLQTDQFHLRNQPFWSSLMTKPFQDRHIQSRMLASPGDSTSISVHDTVNVQAATWISDSASAGIAISDATVYDDENGKCLCIISNYVQRVSLHLFSVVLVLMLICDEVDEPLVIIGPGMQRGTEVSVFSSAPAPPASSVLFAFGTSSVCSDGTTISGCRLLRNQNRRRIISLLKADALLWALGDSSH